LRVKPRVDAARTVGTVLEDLLSQRRVRVSEPEPEPGFQWGRHSLLSSVQ
jgi:hypothetical protein